jgi:hypothetical protein
MIFIAVVGRARPVSCSNHGRGLVHKRTSPQRGGWRTSRVRFLVAIPDQDAARRAIEAWYPGSTVIVEGEAGADVIARHRVKDGTIFMLDDES